MDVIRRNTDYALRLVIGLVGSYGRGPLSAKALAYTADISFSMTSKLLQKLVSAKLAKSTMGKAGGFELVKLPSEISLYDVILVFQGQVCLNQCIANPRSCPKSPKCLVSKKLAGLQSYIEKYLKDITLDELLK